MKHVEGADWVDAVFDWLFSTQPVSATFAGRRGYDDVWPDLSADGIAATANRATDLLALAPSTTDNRWGAVDVALLRAHLEQHVLDASKEHAQCHPALFTGEAIFGLISLLLRDDRPVQTRADHVLSRLVGLPQMLESGAMHLHMTLPGERTRALRELDALHALLDDGLSLDRAMRDVDVRTAANVRAAAHAALPSVDLARAQAANLPEYNYLLGFAEGFLRRLRRDHFIETDENTLFDWALQERDAAQAALHHALDAAGLDSIATLQSALRADHTSADGYDSEFAQVWRSAAEHAVQQRLIDWPAWPIAFRPQPTWARGIAPDLYFLLYRCPPPHSAQVVQEYLYPPLGEAPAATLTAVNRSQITLNHVIHHAGFGHHVQNWHAFRSPSRVGRLAGVDVASRILLPCAGTLVEGWACRAPELMAEVGFLSPLEQLALLHTRLRLAARAVLDLRFHLQGDYHDAAPEYARTVGADAQVGVDEEMRVAMHPGSGIMYLLGQRGLERIAAEHGLHPGQPGSDRRAFHGAVLRCGAIPVSIIAQVLRGADDVRPLSLAEFIPA